MRVELGHHPLDRPVEEPRPLHRLDVPVLDQHEHPGQLRHHRVGRFGGRSGLCQANSVAAAGGGHPREEAGTDQESGASAPAAGAGRGAHRLHLTTLSRLLAFVVGMRPGCTVVSTCPLSSEEEVTVVNDKESLSNLRIEGSKTDKRKQSLYFPESMLQEIKEEAARLDRSLSWVVQRAWKISRLEIKKLPSVNEVEGGEDDDEG